MMKMKRPNNRGRCCGCRHDILSHNPFGPLRRCERGINQSTLKPPCVEWQSNFGRTKNWVEGGRR